MEESFIQFNAIGTKFYPHCIILFCLQVNLCISVIGILKIGIELCIHYLHQSWKHRYWSVTLQQSLVKPVIVWIETHCLIEECSMWIHVLLFKIGVLNSFYGQYFRQDGLMNKNMYSDIDWEILSMWSQKGVAIYVILFGE